MRGLWCIGVGSAAVLAVLLSSGCSSGREPIDQVRFALRAEREAAEARIESRTLRPASFLGPGVARGVQGTGRFAGYWAERAAPDFDAGEAQVQAVPAWAPAPLIVFGNGFENGFESEPVPQMLAPDGLPRGELAPSLREQFEAAGCSTAEQAGRRLRVRGSALLVTLEPRIEAERAIGAVLCAGADSDGEAALMDLALDSCRAVGVALPWPSHRLAFLFGGTAGERAQLLGELGGSWRATLLLSMASGDPADLPTLWRPLEPDAERVEVVSASGLGLLGRAASIDVGLHLDDGQGRHPAQERAHDPERAVGLLPGAPELVFGFAPDASFLEEHLQPLDQRRAQLAATLACTAWALADARPLDLDRHLESWSVELRLRLGLEPAREVDDATKALWGRHMQQARWWLREVCLGLSPAESLPPPTAR